MFSLPRLRRSAPSPSAPKAFPYETAKLNAYGVYSYIDHEAESRHGSIGRDDWVPIPYLFAASYSSLDTLSPLGRYFEMNGVREGQGALEGWKSCTKNQAHEWKARIKLSVAQADAYSKELCRLPLVLAIGVFRPRMALNELLFALHPPGSGPSFLGSREEQQFYDLPENQRYREVLRERYEWLMEQARNQLQEVGFTVDKNLVYVKGYEAIRFDEFDIYSF